MRYYWLKMKRDFFKRHDIRIIEAMPNGKDYLLFYLKLLCESVDHEGCLRFSEQIPYSPEMLSTITDTNVDIVRQAINLFTELDLVEIMDDGTFFMAEVEKMIGAASQDDHSRESGRLRVQAYRERKKQALLEQQTECNVTVTLPKSDGNVKCNGEIEIEKEIEKEIDINSQCEKKPPKAEPIPYEEIVEEYNSICWSLPKVAIINNTRRNAIKRLYMDKEIGRANISLAFQRAQDSPFLKGQNKNGWKASFDWIIKPANMIKILEGNYDGKKGENTKIEMMAEWAEDEKNG